MTGRSCRQRADGVASVVSPDGPPHFSIEHGVAVLIVGGDGMASPHDQLTGVVSDRWWRGVPYLDSSDWSVTVQNGLHTADELVPLYLARVRPGDCPAPVDGVQVCMEKNCVNPSPVPVITTGKVDCINE